MESNSRNTPPTIQFLFENSIFLVSGALIALIWANVHTESYQSFIHYDLTNLPQDISGLVTNEAQGQDVPGADHADEGSAAHDIPIDSRHDGHEVGHEEEHGEHGAGHHSLTQTQVFVNDLLMALFFAIAMKEVFESLLPGGALSNPRRAATPLLATLGGILGPAGVYVAGAALCVSQGWVAGETSFEELQRGWAIPCATDIAFSYLVARMIFGNGHPAIAFLLLLAIADDAAGLVILAIVYPQGDIQPLWLLLTAGAMGLAWVFHRAFNLHSFWWYLLIPGVLSWLSFAQANLHPALGLCPIIPFMPHAHTDLGIFARAELQRHDTLNEFEHWWKWPVEIILGLFGLVNAGVVFSNVGAATWLVLFGLLIGKPFGITLMTWIAEKGLKLEMPGGMTYRHILTIGMIAAIGFTVSLFVSTAAFPASVYPDLLDAAKMGALMSFGAAVLAFIVAKILKIERLKS